MRKFNQQFTLHPIGQGLFYSCVITTEINSLKREFKFLFDCGSLTHENGNEEVDEFRDNYLPDVNAKLGLLVISHFDADHVNKIGRLLQNGAKIDKLVMPFMLLEERLFLALRYINTKGSGFDNDDLYTLNIIIDPIGTLNDNYGDGSTVFLVTSGPDEPFGDGESRLREGEDYTGETPNLEFDFDGPKEELDEKDRIAFGLPAFSVGNIKKVEDIVKGNIHFMSQTAERLMEFLFYRRTIGNDESKFYKVVFELFCKHFKINTNTSPDILLKEIIKAVKKIKGGTIIKKIFKDAKEQVPSIKIRGKELLNLNTTALSMLHINLRTIITIFCKQKPDYRHYYDGDCHKIQKFDGTNVTKTIDYVFHEYYPFHRRQRLLMDLELKFIYPNCLLTSDSYLLQKGEVDAFYNRYRNYWESFWMFQIPHHGSKNNSDMLLFARLNSRLFKFINYGTRHQFEKIYLHPDKEVISDLTAAGHSINLLPINEFSGLTFNFQCQTP